MKNYIIYHNADLDGFCSCVIAKRRLMFNGVLESNIEMIGWNYGNPIPDIPNKSNVIMTDISFPKDNMLLLELHCNLIWIDHHKTAIDDSEELGYHLCAGSRKVGDSASLLAWKFFFPYEDIPEVVYWVDRYDVWKKEDQNRPEANWKMVMEAQQGMRLSMNNPDVAFDEWLWLFDDNSSMETIMQDGELIMRFEEKSNQIRCSKAFDLVFEGHKFAVVNNTLAGSSVLNSYARSDHDGLMVFSYHGKKQKWDVSLYGNELSSQQVDLSVIAKKYGGGGHANACGFMVDNINEIIGR